MIKPSISYFLRREWPLLIIMVLGVSEIFGAFSLYILILLLPLLVFNSNSIKILKDSLVYYILGFSISYVALLYLNKLDRGPSYSIYTLLYPIIFYLIGKRIGKYNSKYILIFFLILFVSFEFITILFSIISINKGGIINTSRSFIDITGFDFSATLYGVNVSLGLAGLPLIFVTSTNKAEKVFKYMFFLLGILSLMVNIQLLNRTGIIIVLANFLLLMMIFFKNKKFSSGTIVTILIFLIAIIYIIHLNPDIINAYAKRNENTSETLLNGGDRFNRWSNALADIYKHPFGGGVYMYNVRFYAHNLWLDVVEICGFIPFTFLFIGTIKAIKLNIKCVNNQNKYSFFFRCYIAMLGLTFFLQCSMEPIMEGALLYFCLYMLFWGIIRSSSFRFVSKNNSI